MAIFCKATGCMKAAVMREVKLRGGGAEESAPRTKGSLGTLLCLGCWPKTQFRNPIPQQQAPIAVLSLLRVVFVLPFPPRMSSPSSSSSAPSIPSAEEVKTEVVEASKQTLSSFRSLIAGGVGGICAVVVGHPFDLVKVRMQTAEKGVYSGALDVVRKTVAREGLRKVSHWGSEGRAMSCGADGLNVRASMQVYQHR